MRKTSYIQPGNRAGCLNIESRIRSICHVRPRRFAYERVLLSCPRGAVSTGNRARGTDTKHAMLLFQSGGPTAVLNASLVGAIRAAQAEFGNPRILGARNGVEGILEESFIDLSSLTDSRLDRLMRTPSAALGTTRLRPDDARIEQVLDILIRNRIESVIGIGGNDTADTSDRLAKLAEAR